ncbi:unnamed protein product [Orchesella dallaii]|uniref:Uncharacterized protein n=1 Tax=Orchesella dallaii TaxID=48710 RepID=A0ABP1QKH7_9HEXA
MTLPVVDMSPPQEGRKEGSSKASDKTAEDIVDSGIKDLGSPLANPSTPQSTSVNQETPGN